MLLDLTGFIFNTCIYFHNFGYITIYFILLMILFYYSTSPISIPHHDKFSKFIFWVRLLFYLSFLSSLFQPFLITNTRCINRRFLWEYPTHHIPFNPNTSRFLWKYILLSSRFRFPFRYGFIIILIFNINFVMYYLTTFGRFYILIFLEIIVMLVHFISIHNK